MFIENEGALFKGSSRREPSEVRDHKLKSWVAYPGKLPKPADWGREISEAECNEWIAEAEASDHALAKDGVP